MASVVAHQLPDLLEISQWSPCSSHLFLFGTTIAKCLPSKSMHFVSIGLQPLRRPFKLAFPFGSLKEMCNPRQASSKICNRKNCIHYVDVNGIIDPPSPSRLLPAKTAAFSQPTSNRHFILNSQFFALAQPTSDGANPRSLVWWTLDGRFGSITVALRSRAGWRDGSGGKFLLGGDQTDGKLLCPSGNPGKAKIVKLSPTARYRPRRSPPAAGIHFGPC